VKVSWTRRLRAGLDDLLDLLLPACCPGCGGHEFEPGGLCEPCSIRLLTLAAVTHCPRCGASLGPNIPPRPDGCRDCQATLPRFAQVVRLGPYADPLRRIVRELKYRRHEAMLSRLGAMLAAAVETRCADEEFDLLVPVPSHWLRRLARGADHTLSIARELGRRLRLPVAGELSRVRHTAPQVNLSRAARIRNVRGAFAARDRRALAGTNVLLVDDVTTTGATADEAAATLLHAGASRVTLAVVAKSEPQRAYLQHLAPSDNCQSTIVN